MDQQQFSRRSWSLVALLFLMLFVLGAALYDAQVVNGDYWAQRSKTNISSTEIITASRGGILDRYGRVLVSNQASYQVTLNTSVMKKERNAILLELIDISRKSGVVWADSLPISATPPFTFTTDAPLLSTSTREDGTTKQTLTRLGRLAVKMKWMEDPTKNPAAKLPTAEELLAGMFDSFDISGQGDSQLTTVAPLLDSGGLSLEEARALCGVLYELYLRSKDIYYTPYLFAEDVDIDFISQVKEHGLAGVNIDAVTTRQYNTPFAAHILGQVGLMNDAEIEYYCNLDEDGDGSPDYQQNESVGKFGVEQAFESYLRGTPGKKLVERDTTGKIVNETWLTQPDPGDNLILTLDIDLQAAVENALADGLPKLKSKEVQGASCVVLDVDSAEILATASYPTYDPNTYYKDYSQTASDPLKPLLNRAFTGQYPPGSTFKMVTAIAGLEEGYITPRSIVVDNGRYTYYNRNGPQCWIFRQQGGTHGPQNVTDAIKNSCNIFFFDTGRQVTIDGLQKYAAAFGLGQPSGVELPEASGTMAGPKNEEERKSWQPGSTLSVAIGQENSQFTPLQLANYVATLVNGGTLYTPHLLKSVKSNDFSQVIYTQEPEARSSIDIAPQNLEAVKQGMLKVTTEGSASYYFRSVPVLAGAKTGSAQVSSSTESHALFVCFAPYDDPQIAVAIAVEHGGSGSDVASIASNILASYFSAEETREEILTENTMIR